MDTTILGLQNHFSLLYGKRNQCVNGSYPERSAHMTRRIGRIADAERKSERMPGRLARAFSYFMSVVNFHGGLLDLQQGMMEKFPMTGCLYCSHMPCNCDEAQRPTPNTYTLQPEQTDWTLSRWQQHLKDVYGWRNMHPDKFWKLFGRLTSEWGELCILSAHGPDTPITPIGILEESKREAADVLSWLLTLAYHKGIDLEQAIVERYKTCPGCNLLPCDCPLVFISQDGKSFSTVGYPGRYSVRVDEQPGE